MVFVVFDRWLKTRLSRDIHSAKSFRYSSECFLSDYALRAGTLLSGIDENWQKTRRKRRKIVKYRGSIYNLPKNSRRFNVSGSRHCSRRFSVKQADARSVVYSIKCATLTRTIRVIIFSMRPRVAWFRENKTEIPRVRRPRLNLVSLRNNHTETTKWIFQLRKLKIS